MRRVNRKDAVFWLMSKRYSCRMADSSVFPFCPTPYGCWAFPPCHLTGRVPVCSPVARPARVADANRGVPLVGLDTRVVLAGDVVLSVIALRVSDAVGGDEPRVVPSHVVGGHVGVGERANVVLGEGFIESGHATMVHTKPTERKHP